MKRRILSALVLAPSLAFGVADLNMSDFKDHLQVGEFETTFLGGTLNLNMSDGAWTLAGCLFHPSPSIVPPNIFCPLGTTGFIAQGDINEDGIRDDGSFWSVASVTAATDVEPFQTDRVRIIAAPPSGIADILRATRGDIAAIFEVSDFSVLIWYNYLAQPINDFELTRMRLDRLYGPGNSELERQYYDIPWGNYLLEFPILNDPLRERGFGINHLTTPDIYPGRGALPSGWRVINGTWNDDGFLEVDPRTFFSFIWQGINPNNTIVSDQLFFSMRGNQTQIVLVLDPDGNPIVNPGPDGILGTDDDFLETTTVTRADTIVFPPYPIDTPEGDRVPFLMDIFTPFYELAPFFFFPGDSAEAVLDWRRNIVAGGNTRDTPRRILRWVVSFIDSWEGFVIFSAPFSEGGYPLGTPTQLRKPNLDFDGDGATDLLEFAFSSDIADATSMPVFEFDTGDQTGSGACFGQLTKRVAVGDSLTYEFEYTDDITDSSSWRVIREGSADWMITEGVDPTTGAETLRVDWIRDSDMDGMVDLPAACFVRVRVRLN